MVEGGVAIVKYILFLSNLVLWVAGLGLIITGTVMQLKFQYIFDLLGDDRLATPHVLIALGFMCTLLGFLGCCGAIRENYCLTVSFAVLLALVMMVETAAIIAGYALIDPLEKSFGKELTDGLKRYGKSEGVTWAWDEMQQKFQCCGVHNSTDFLGNLPESCCVQQVSNCIKSKAPIHTSGCMIKAQNFFSQHTLIVGILSTVVVTLQVLGVCFACCLSKSILKDFHDFYY
ncbi:unnamed protein product, partial [Mesorhabditis belari]|uniref:Tetraspanin n=1 Tax=Mesorhabditis belari TaxID=2138241 RepID=A0AAF3J2E9_9BILA